LAGCSRCANPAYTSLFGETDRFVSLIIYPVFSSVSVKQTTNRQHRTRFCLPYLIEKERLKRASQTVGLFAIKVEVPPFPLSKRENFIQSPPTHFHQTSCKIVLSTNQKANFTKIPTPKSSGLLHAIAFFDGLTGIFQPEPMLSGENIISIVPLICAQAEPFRSDSPSSSRTPLSWPES